ncbi:unnamed protein product, partial [marine sediment metagenome]
GIVQFALTSTDTMNGADDNATLVLGTNVPGGLPHMEWDDLYICDSLGSKNNDFLGDKQSALLLPNGNGTTSGLTGQDADSTDNYLNVDETDPDGDTTYNEGVTTEKDTYDYEDLPADTKSVTAIGVQLLGKKVDAGAPDLIAVVRSGTTEEDSAAVGMTTDYTVGTQQIFEDDPDAGPGDWDETSVNAMEAGAKVV